jgi:hypothetical protein
MTQEVITRKKDKKAVEGEVFDDARVRGFLDVLPPLGVDADFHALEVAYRGMTPDSFERFVSFFLEAGRNLQAQNPQGQTITDLVRQHRHGDEYLPFLQ